MEFKKMKEEFFEKMGNVKVAFTGLNHEEKDILSAMTDFKIKTSTIDECTLLVYGSDIQGNTKINVAKEEGIPMISLSEFKRKYMFNHKYGDLLEGKTVGVSLSFPDVEAVYLMNPKSVYFINSLNKKRAISLDYFFSETSRIGDLHNKLSFWLQNENRDVKIILDQNELSPS